MSSTRGIVSLLLCFAVRFFPLVPRSTEWSHSGWTGEWWITRTKVTGPSWPSCNVLWFRNTVGGWGNSFQIAFKKTIVWVGILLSRNKMWRTIQFQTRRRIKGDLISSYGLHAAIFSWYAALFPWPPPLHFPANHKFNHVVIEFTLFVTDVIKHNPKKFIQKRIIHTSPSIICRVNWFSSWIAMETCFNRPTDLRKSWISSSRSYAVPDSMLIAIWSVWPPCDDVGAPNKGCLALRPGLWERAMPQIQFTFLKINWFAWQKKNSKNWLQPH